MTTSTQKTSPPRLTFACELEPEPLERLFDAPSVIEHLLALDATISLGLLDLSDDRARVVRRLNRAGVPLVAWLLLPKEEGYWFHAGNVACAKARYDAFERWTAQHGLQWEGIGFDVEPQYSEMQQIVTGGALQLLPRLAARLFSGKAVERAGVVYGELVARALEAGYRAESYQLPFIVDDRQAGAQILHRALRLVDVPVQCEILMLYTSFARQIGPGLLWSYGPDAGGIGVGSTGGGVEMPGEPLPLTWEELARDLRLARAWTDHVFVFGLEGCVRHGYLARLLDFDWNGKVAPPTDESARVDRWRRLGRAVLWAGAHPGWILAVGAGVWLLSHLVGLLRKR